MIPASERGKTADALDGAATVTGSFEIIRCNLCKWLL
jgi:hypothetical protein